MLLISRQHLRNPNTIEPYTDHPTSTYIIYLQYLMHIAALRLKHSN